jgi:hypothetical protein
MPPPRDACRPTPAQRSERGPARVLRPGAPRRGQPRRQARAPSRSGSTRRAVRSGASRDRPGGPARRRRGPGGPVGSVGNGTTSVPPVSCSPVSHRTGGCVSVIDSPRPPRGPDGPTRLPSLTPPSTTPGSRSPARDRRAGGPHREARPTGSASDGARSGRAGAGRTNSASQGQVPFVGRGSGWLPIAARAAVLTTRKSVSLTAAGGRSVRSRPVLRPADPKHHLREVRPVRERARPLAHRGQVDCLGHGRAAQPEPVGFHGALGYASPARICACGPSSVVKTTR